MALDLDRLWHRNMGRDDRVISYNGKEARFPFLDRTIQQYLRDIVPDITPDDKHVLYSLDE